MKASTWLVLASVTIFSRFGINVGEYSVEPALVSLYVLLGVALAFGCLSVSAIRLVTLVTCLATAFASYALNTAWAHVDHTSGSSLLLFCVIHLPFACVIGAEAVGWDAIDAVVDQFITIAMICAVAGIAQFYAQFFIHQQWLFNFTEQIPQAIRAGGIYNTVVPVGRWYKSNGFFLREPSTFSFLMAMAILTEWYRARRRSWLLVFAVGLLLSYSGTGIVTLLFGTLFPLSWRTIGRLAAVSLVGLLLVGVLGEVLNLSFTVDRIHEFSNTRSSGYIRYIAPLRVLGDNLWSDPWSPWLGHGPGSLSRQFEAYEFHDPTWAKLLFEYGLLGFGAVVALFLCTVRVAGAGEWMPPVLFCTWLVIGGNLLTAGHDALCLVLAGFFRIPVHLRFREMPFRRPAAEGLHP